MDCHGGRCHSTRRARRYLGVSCLDRFTGAHRPGGDRAADQVDQGNPTEDAEASATREDDVKAADAHAGSGPKGTADEAREGSPSAGDGVADRSDLQSEFDALNDRQFAFFQQLRESVHRGVKADIVVDFVDLSPSDGQSVPIPIILIVSIGNDRVDSIVAPGQLNHDQDLLAR